MNVTKCLDNLNELSYQLNIINSQTILVVQDPLCKDKEIVANQLKKSGYRIKTASGFQEGLKASTSSEISLVVLDWDEATEISLAFIIAFKQHPLTKNVPLIFVTSTFNDQIFVDYLQAGADDYVTKPCLNYVLGVRIRFALLQLDKFLTSNHLIAHDDQAKIPKLKFDSTQRALFLDKAGKVVSIELCPIGYKLLYFLAQHPDLPISRTMLKKHLCGEKESIDDRTIDVYIRRLRLVLSKNKIEEIIKTVRGVGYSFNSSLVTYLLA